MAAPQSSSPEWVTQLGPQDLRLARERVQPLTQLGGLAGRDMEVVARALALSALIAGPAFMERLRARLHGAVRDAVLSANDEGRGNCVWHDVLEHVLRLEAVVSAARKLLAPHAADLLDGVQNAVRDAAGLARAAAQKRELQQTLDDLARRAHDAPGSTRLRRP